MKRYLVTLTGRANCIYGKLRGNELVCSYVHANSKKKAIELFWGELEKNENFYCYSRRDFKIEAELWNENELDHYGNPLKDWESAIDFNNLHLIRFNHCTGKYEILSAEMEKAEQIKSEEAHQLAQAVAQMDADQVCSIIKETLRKPQESSEPVAQENIQPEPEDATESISEPHKASIPDSNKKYHVQLWKIGTAVDNLQDCGIWDGYGMSNFRAGFGGFIYQDGEWLYYASESLPDENKEIIKESTAKPTEEKSEGKEGITTSLIAVGDFLVIEERKNGESWAYYHGNDFLWSSAERFSQDDLLRMYENGYFMEELTKQRIRKYDAIEKCKENDFPDDVLVRMRNELNAIDDEIARLFLKEVKDEHI